MFINAHCHVFNVQSVFSQATLDIFKNRIESTNLKKSIQGAILDMVTAVVMNRSEGSLVDRIIKPLNLPEFVEAALANTMDEVTDRLFDATRRVLGPGEEILVVPLMMDILTGEPGDAPRDKDLFNGQLAGTRRQILRYPGHVLPFVAVNPMRDGAAFGEDNAVKLMKDAIKYQGFVGVKLYPGLGYTPQDLAACGDGSFFDFVSQNELPITQHTNPEGFRADLRFWDYSQPDRWDGLLRDYQNFRINFAHFGGGNCFLDPKKADHPAHVEWKKQIFTLMAKYPGRVFTDVSYHDQPWTGFIYRFKRNAYFKALNAVLDDSRYGPHVLFGTDFFLVLMAALEDKYIEVFRKGLGESNLQAMANTNPRAFLGMGHGTDADPHKENIRNHIEFIKGKRTEAERDGYWAEGSPPASWLDGLL